MWPMDSGVTSIVLVPKEIRADVAVESVFRFALAGAH